MQKYDSISTPGVYHDAANLLTEIMLINRFGVLPEFCWRRNEPLHEEWSSLVVKIKRLMTKLDIKPEQLAWYIRKTKITEINYEQFGLLHYRIKKHVRSMSLEKLAEIYRRLLQSKIGDSSSYLETAGYQAKPVEKSSKSLLDFIKELEQ